MLLLSILLINLADLAIAAIFGVLAFGFGVFFWISVENHPAEHLIGTTICGIAFVVSLLMTLGILATTKWRVNRMVDRASRDETAAQMKAKSLTSVDEYDRPKTWHI